jgi:hypothetical protein
MFPQIRQIQRLVVDGQELQVERVGVDGLENGIGIERGWEEEGG